MKNIETVLNSGIFGELKKSEYIEAFEALSISDRRYRKGNHVFMEEDTVDKLCIVTSGTIRGEKTSPDGEVHIVSIFEPGDIMALEIFMSRKKISALNYICNEDSEIIFITRKSIENSKFNKGINKALTYMLADENIRMGHKIEILGQRGLRERIMAYLGVLQSKAGGDTVTIKMNREQLAQFLCVNRSALSNELSKMKKEGVIDFKGSKFIIKSLRA